MLEISDVRIKKIDKGDFLCYASICIDDKLIIDGIKLLQGKNGRYILMPIRIVNGNNKKRNFAYPTNNETREQLLELISEAYDNQ